MQTKIDLMENEEVAIVDIKVAAKKTETIKLIDASEIQKKEMPPINWIVYNLLPEGLAVLAGRPKIGKSWMALDIAIAVARGYQALGKFNTVKNAVLYIPYEDNFRRLKDRINKIIRGDITEKAPDNLYYPENNFDFPKLNENGLEEIEKIIDSKPEIKFVIIDTLGRGIADKPRRDRSMYHGDYDISSKIQKLAISKKICILLLHHTRKEKSENVFDEISGTTGITAGMDTMLVLRKNGDKHSLHITGRDVAENEYSIEFDEINCVWRIASHDTDIEMTTERKEIIETLKKFGRKMRTGEIADALEKSKSNVSKMLGKMVKAGSLISASYGVYDLPEEMKEKPEEEKQEIEKDEDDESWFPN